MRRSIRAVCTPLASALAMLLLPVSLATGQSRHPLDPLSWEEHWVILEVLRDAGHFNDSTRIALVTLDEPAKDVVWSWRADAAGAAVPRRALAVVKQQSHTYEAVIDVTAERLVRWDERPGVQPNWLNEDFGAAIGAVMKHPDFIAAMARRGITDFTFIDCGGGPPGYFGLAEEEGRRVSYVGCVDERRVRNTWPRHIEGLTVVVDVNEGTVLRVVDEGVVPIPATRAEYFEDEIGPLRSHATPIDISQPLGPAFSLDGHQVQWDAWSFHVRPDQRVGMVLSTVRFRDGERDRPVLYRGSLSEIFVPYMDPSFSWYPRNFLDAGEYVAGGLAKPLEPGIDCPGNAVYLQQLVVRDNGRPRTVPRTICIFERLSGDMAWRHSSGQGVDGRPKRDLVVRSAAVLGNYDYIFDWVFQQDGAIRVSVGATGITEVRMVAERNAVLAAASNGGSSNGGSLNGGRADEWGRFVDENLIAVNHDHYFSYRIDLDVDGSVNSFSTDRLETVVLPPDHPRRSVWAVRSTIAAREHDARLDMDMHRPALWRVVNTAESNRVGYNTSYQLVPGMNIHTLLTPDDFPRRRAGFIDHHLWVTPYRSDELYSAGMYPTLSRPGEGLPAWTQANRSIQATDIVLWYTFGMHHVARAEDWPVMPVAWHSFELRPFDFFDENPALRASKKP
jgi:primary-amine oxidase